MYFQWSVYSSFKYNVFTFINQSTSRIPPLSKLFNSITWNDKDGAKTNIKQVKGRKLNPTTLSSNYLGRQSYRVFVDHYNHLSFHSRSFFFKLESTEILIYYEIIATNFLNINQQVSNDFHNFPIKIIKKLINGINQRVINNSNVYFILIHECLLSCLLILLNTNFRIILN